MTQLHPASTSTLASIADLAGFGLGLAVEAAAPQETYGVLPRAWVRHSSAGDLSQVVPHVARRGALDLTFGSGTSFDSEHARLVSLVEAAERYASKVFSAEQMEVGPAASFGSEAVDVDQLPRLSRAEYANPGCPFQPFDADTVLRWVPAVDLNADVTRLVPLELAYLGVPYPAGVSPHFVQISTGCAAHTDLATAVLKGILEVVERDASSLAWLQMLPLPAIDPSVLTSTAREITVEQAAMGIESRVFDATTDLGIPVAYVLQVARFASVAAQLVAAASGLTVAEAAEKALLEAVQLRRAMCDAVYVHDQSWNVSSDSGVPELFTNALRLGEPAYRDAFSFLSGDADRTAAVPAQQASIRDLRGDDGRGSADTASPRRRLAGVLDIFRQRGIQVLALDISTDELKRVGFYAVKVIIPRLQPFSPVAAAQYRGHARLYEAPAAMGFRVRSEQELNPFQNPFA